VAMAIRVRLVFNFYFDCHISMFRIATVTTLSRLSFVFQFLLNFNTDMNVFSILPPVLVSICMAEQVDSLAICTGLLID
jgi:hypothetical protein